MTPFDFINAINQTKADLFKEPLANKDYDALKTAIETDYPMLRSDLVLQSIFGSNIPKDLEEKQIPGLKPLMTGSSLDGGVDDDGRIGQAQAIYRVQHATDARVEIFGNRRDLELLGVVALQMFVLGFRRLERVALCVQCVPRKLDVERLAGLFVLAHELFRSLGHAEDVDRVRVGELEGLFVARVAIMFIVAVVSRSAAADVPLAIMGGGITGTSKDFRHGRFIR